MNIATNHILVSGSVKFFNEEKGFGFIERDDGQPDMFAHASNLDGHSLFEGDIVSFLTKVGKQGLELGTLLILNGRNIPAHREESAPFVPPPAMVEQVSTVPVLVDSNFLQRQWL